MSLMNDIAGLSKAVTAVDIDDFRDLRNREARLVVLLLDVLTKLGHNGGHPPPECLRCRIEAELRDKP